ncbi:hypothetical protein BASA82_000078 [Batrachochytrium salamandrivorans]|nr:hypothetical protein BASA81_000754 [Batrachochytrium salamandrivorans]KAH9262895.1 hypothetical protein BASA82_000078 [Batrachochytrium salamandrivorans]
MGQGDGYVVLENESGEEDGNDSGAEDEMEDSALDALMRDYNNTLAQTKTPKSLVVDSLLESLESRVAKLERTILLLLIKQEEE